MRKRLLIAASVLLVGLVAAGSALVLRRSAVARVLRPAVEARLSAALGQKVAIGDVGLSLTPLPAFTGSEIVIGAADGNTGPGVRIDRIRVVPYFRSFFTNTVRIEEIRLDGFTVSVLRDSARKWRTPAAFPAPSHDARAGIVIERVHIAGGRLQVIHESERGARNTWSIDDIRADMLIEAAGLRLAPLTGRVGGTAIDGEARADPRTIRLTFNAPAIADVDLAPLLGLLGASRPAIVRLDEPAASSVTVTIDRAASRLTGTGTIRAPALTVDPLRLQRVEAPFTIDGSQLTFTPTTFVLNGGSHRGSVTMRLDAEPARWSDDSTIERLDFGALLDTLAGRDARIDGSGRINGTVQGRFERDFARGIDGRAQLVISNGVLRDFPLLATINRALRLAAADSNDTRFERLAATLAIARGSATTDDLAIDAADLRVYLAGRIGFDRSLDLRGRAVVSAQRAAAAVASVRELARLRKGSGEIELPLTIAGTLDAPQFGLDLETAIREGVRDELMRRLRGFIRRPPHSF